MKTELLSLLILFVFSNCAIALSGLQNGECSGSTYTFEIKAKDAENEVTENLAISLTFSSPSSSTQATCTNQAAQANTDFVFECSISSASITNTAVTISSVTLNDTPLSISGTLSIADVTCPATGAVEAEKNTLTITGKTEGSCADNVYSFTVTGTVTTATTVVTTWTPTFTAPTNPTASCSMPIVSTAGGSGTITCKITSSLSNSAITLTKLVATGFNDVTLSGDNSAIATGKTCEGTTNNNDSSNGSKFIYLDVMLFCILFFIF